jgi:hypothetical protein
MNKQITTQYRSQQSKERFLLLNFLFALLLAMISALKCSPGAKGLDDVIIVSHHEKSIPQCIIPVPLLTLTDKDLAAIPKHFGP